MMIFKSSIFITKDRTKRNTVLEHKSKLIKVFGNYGKLIDFLV